MPKAMAAFCEQAWHAGYSGSVGRQDWLRRFMPDADNARQAMAQAVANGDRVAALQIGATRCRAESDLPAAQRLALAEQCLAQLPHAGQSAALSQASLSSKSSKSSKSSQSAESAEPVPPALQVRTWVQVSAHVHMVRGGQGLEAAHKAWQRVQADAGLRSG